MPWLLRRLLPKLNTSPLTHRTSSSVFGVNLSKNGNFFQQLRCLHIRPIRVVDGNEEDEEPTTERGARKKMFSRIRETALDNPKLSAPMDCVMRNSMRYRALTETQKFGTMKSMLGKNLTWLQLVLTDENRWIQEKLVEIGSDAGSEGYISEPHLVERSRDKFGVVASCLLQDIECWVFSRSLVLKEYGGLIDEGMKFMSYDPFGDLKNVNFDVPLGTPFKEVIGHFPRFMKAAMKAYEQKPVDMLYGIRCVEVFMFIAGDYAVNDEGLSNREAVLRLLHELNTAEGLTKIQGFYEVVGGAKISPDKLSMLRDLHITVREAA